MMGNLEKASILNMVARKDRCEDIFRNAHVSKGVRMFNKISHKEFVLSKLKKIQNELILQKMCLVVCLRLVNGPLFLRVLLKKIEVKKKMFVYNIERGQEVFIPRELSQDQLPLSFRYYDPLISII